MCCLCQPEVLPEEEPFFRKNYPDRITLSKTPEHYTALALKKGRGSCVFLDGQRRCEVHQHRTAYCKQFPYHIYVSDRVKVEADLSCRGLWTGRGADAAGEARAIVSAADARIREALPQARAVYREFYDNARSAGVMKDPAMLRMTVAECIGRFADLAFVGKVLELSETEADMSIAAAASSGRADMKAISEAAAAAASESIASNDPLNVPLYGAEDFSWNVFTAARGIIEHSVIGDDGEFSRRGFVAIGDIEVAEPDEGGKRALVDYLTILNGRDSFLGSALAIVDENGYVDDMGNAYYGSLATCVLDILWRAALLDRFFHTGFGARGIKEAVIFYDMDRLDAPTIGAFVRGRADKVKIRHPYRAGRKVAVWAQSPSSAPAVASPGKRRRHLGEKGTWEQEQQRREGTTSSRRTSPVAGAVNARTTSGRATAPPAGTAGPPSSGPTAGPSCATESVRSGKMAGPGHECGVVGIGAEHDVVAALHKSLMIIQHRGQESAGISVFSDGEIHTIKDAGLVQNALSKEKLASLHGNVGIGHVRYSTVGGKSMRNAQPLMLLTGAGMIAVAHNGDLTNYEKLKQKCLESGALFQTSSDSELIINIMSRYLRQNNDPVLALRATMSEIDGAYSLAVLVDGRLFGVRDPLGIHPLVLGRISDGHIIVSETAAIDALGGEFVRDVMPGEIVEITPDKLRSYPSKFTMPCAHCMFEWVYFARPDSAIDGRTVYDVRRRIGEILARECPADVDLVMPIPDSGRAHAIGFSNGSGIPYQEGFMKNRFAERTFILPDQKEREHAVSTKMNPIRSTVAGKRILIVDDSIVRGTTLKQLIAMLRKAGAKEVHVRSGSPPIIAPCYYGVDMKTRDQFIATGHTFEDIARIIGADSVGYISLGGLVEAIGFPAKDLCLGCVTGEYPTRIEGERERFQTTLSDEPSERTRDTGPCPRLS